MEKTYAIETGDGCLIHGVLNSKSQTDKLVVFIHGLTGEKENHLYYNGARYFPEHGFDAFRVDLFSNEAKGRKLTDCSISTFVSDLNRVTANFYGIYKDIYLIGHSIGGCVVINSDQQNIARIALWDTALFDKTKTSSPFVYNKALDKYIANLKIGYLLSKGLITERSMQDERIISSIKRPVKLVFAGNSHAKDIWKDKLRLINSEYETAVIENAGHGFNEDMAAEKLFKETLDWFSYG